MCHPLKSLGYEFPVPLLSGEHVTDDTGTGFVHTAPGHGVEDFEVWMANKTDLDERGIKTTIPYTVDGDGFLTDEAPGFDGKRVLTEKGKKGDANEAVILALQRVASLAARSRLKHQYPHSWRSKNRLFFGTHRNGLSPWIAHRTAMAILCGKLLWNKSKKQVGFPLREKPHWRDD